MSLIDVSCDDGNVMLARILHPRDEGFMVQFLEETSTPNVFKFNKEKEFIEQSSIQGYYDTEDLTQAGYSDMGDGKYTNADSDYEPSDEEDSEDESLCDEDDEEEEED